MSSRAPSPSARSSPAPSSSKSPRRKPKRPADAPTARTQKRTIDLGEIEDLRVLDECGTADADLDPRLDPDELLRVHRAMVLTRKLDVRMLAMQRQGEMGTFAPGFGQEATQIGQVQPLREVDWYSPSYRSFGAQIWRGWTIEGLLLLWDGFFAGFEIPQGVNDLPFSIVIGSHVAPAVGIGMAIRSRGDEGVVLVNFGDGALSQGPVAEAMNFAAVYRSPVVFVVENNGYAISMPADKQAAVPELARRGPGFGIPSIRVDGNDVLAVIVAVREAVERARRGEGPSLVEAVTYRMSLHTTADDPKVYRDDAEVEAWQARCPIGRFEKYLSGRGLIDEAGIERIAGECEQQVLEARERFRERAVRDPHDIFDFMYESLPPELQRQKDEYLEKLRRKGVEPPT